MFHQDVSGRVRRDFSDSHRVYVPCRSIPNQVADFEFNMVTRIWWKTGLRAVLPYRWIIGYVVL